MHQRAEVIFMFEGQKGGMIEEIPSSGVGSSSFIFAGAA